MTTQTPVGPLADKYDRLEGFEPKVGPMPCESCHAPVVFGWSGGKAIMAEKHLVRLNTADWPPRTHTEYRVHHCTGEKPPERFAPNHPSML